MEKKTNKKKIPIAFPTTGASAAREKPKKLSEILVKNVSTFEKGFAARISNERINNMLFEILVKFQLCNQATTERLMLHQRLGEGPDGSG